MSTTAPRSTAKGCSPMLWLLAFLIIVGGIYWSMGVYTIQPLGAIPQGGTVIVWRKAGEPFFNSPDATCLNVQGGVSIFCRLFALKDAPTDRIILRLPYQHWAYLLSTGGLTFER